MVTKELTILAVHGEVVEADVQRILDEKSRRAPPPGWEGPFDPQRGPFMQAADFPKAVCTGVIIVEGASGDNTRVELYVDSFADMAGLVAGAKVTLTLTVVPPPA